MQERINESPTEPQQVVTQPVVETPAAPVAPEAVVTPPVTTTPTKPAAPETPATEVATDLLSVFKNPEIIKEDPVEKQYKEKFLSEYKDLIEIGEVAKADKFLSDYLKYRNDPDFNPAKLLVVNTTDYNALDPLQLHLLDLKNKGIPLTPEEESKEVELFNEKYEGLSPASQKALKMELLEKMPKPQDPMQNWATFVAEKEKADKEYSEALQTNAKQLSDFGAKLVGVEFEGVKISQTDVRNVLAEIYNEWEAGYFTPNGQKQLEDRLLANLVKNNWDAIKENLRVKYETEFLVKRTNAQPNNAPRNAPAGGLTQEQEDQIHKLRVQFGSNRGLFEQKLKESGLPIVN